MPALTPMQEAMSVFEVEADSNKHRAGFCAPSIVFYVSVSSGM